MQQSAAIAVIVLGFVLTPTWAVAGGGQSDGTATGRFASSYGFAVEIPRGRVAFPQAVVGNHGVIIPLGTQGTESPGRIDFYAAGNVLFWKTATDAAAAWLESLSERALGNIATVVARKHTMVRVSEAFGSPRAIEMEILASR